MTAPQDVRQSSLRVTAKTPVADGVVALTLADPAGNRLPDWTPGSHLDLVLSTGTTRQYSLCGDRWDAHSYRVAVLREPAGCCGPGPLLDAVEAACAHWPAHTLRTERFAAEDHGASARDTPFTVVLDRSGTGDCMFVCVSRSLGDRLVLDL